MIKKSKNKSICACRITVVHCNSFTKVFQIYSWFICKGLTIFFNGTLQYKLGLRSSIFTGECCYKIVGPLHIDITPKVEKKNIVINKY